MGGGFKRAASRLPGVNGLPFSGCEKREKAKMFAEGRGYREAKMPLRKFPVGRSCYFQNALWSEWVASQAPPWRSRPDSQCIEGHCQELFCLRPIWGSSGAVAMSSGEGEGLIKVFRLLLWPEDFAA